jgi:hypothetical protein
MSKEFLHMQKLAGIITEGEYNAKMNENEGIADEVKNYFKTMIETQPEDALALIMDLVKNDGKNWGEWIDNIQADIVDTYGGDYKGNIRNYREEELNEELNEENIADFLNSNMDEVKEKLGDIFSEFETIGDPKVATAGEGEEGIDVSFDKEHMLELFPEGDPYNEVESIDIAGKTVYYNDYR